MLVEISNVNTFNIKSRNLMTINDSQLLLDKFIDDFEYSS